jgi:adenosylcobyric acid synthase
MSGTAALPPAFILADGQPDGCVSASGTVVGTYLHGLLDNALVRRALLEWVAARKGLPPESLAAPPPAAAEAEYDRLAAVLRQSLDVSRLYQIAGLVTP